MSKALVASFGFDEKFVVRAILRHGVSAGDEVVLVTGSPTDKTVKAYKYVESLVQNANASVRLVPLGDKVYDFTDMVRSLKNLLVDLSKRHETVTLIFSGGMRALVLGLYTAALLLPNDIKRKLVMELDTEDQGHLVRIPTELALLLNSVELGAKVDVLRVVVDNPGIEVQKVSAVLSKDETTIRRQLQALAKHGLVKIDGKPQKAYPTPIAKVLV